MDILHVDDLVIWRGAWGKEAPRTARVKSIGIATPDDPKAESRGAAITAAPWSMRDSIVVDLDNGHWAYGNQIEPMTWKLCARCGANIPSITPGKLCHDDQAAEDARLERICDPNQADLDGALLRYMGSER